MHLSEPSQTLTLHRLQYIKFYCLKLEHPRASYVASFWMWFMSSSYTHCTSSHIQSLKEYFENLWTLKWGNEVTTLKRRAVSKQFHKILQKSVLRKERDIIFRCIYRHTLKMGVKTFNVQEFFFDFTHEWTLFARVCK